MRCAEPSFMTEICLVWLLAKSMMARDNDIDARSTFMPQPAERVSRGHERIRAPLFTSALEPTSAACAWAREAREGRSGFVSARTHGDGPSRRGAQWRQRQASQVKTRLEEKYCTVTVEPLHRLDLRLASSFFSFFPAASMFHLARVRMPQSLLRASHISDLTYPCFRFQHSIRYHGTRDLPGYEYTERQPPGST